MATMRYALVILFCLMSAGASTNDPHAFIKNQTKHAVLAHEQSFPYVLNDASQNVPFRTQHISPETAVATETHRKIYFIILLKPHKSTAL